MAAFIAKNDKSALPKPQDVQSSKIQDLTHEEILGMELACLPS